ncbi:ABC transporter permease [Paramaledivibacter caminithermalis]|jgi:tungstate transport system permease protein|uniref:Tungstate transport system permease protein n=1 Tax=Paramaledivibacter caminithermalis (strain DSM 15212 / CIP 107654 / DViRD3) TaxID=1121301 RepID=A0A1M6KW45_PARC5|nr:ABC transporter permease [Paramaledivibacter caminithermalis]SHJ63159.1 tungstate transport system permease protein [Paramaledivibacter caminithermalis DSM 15212]
MGYIFDGIIKAFKLLIFFDKEVYSIIFLSIFISLTSTLISSFIGIPLGFLIGLKKFRFKRIVARLLYTFMSLPPVVVGLVVAIIISRRGPLGHLRLLFTPAAMIIAQTLLVTPIITGIIFNNSKEQGHQIKQICKTLGGNRWDTLILLIKEMRINILIAVVTGFGRAISEVGAVMIVGGNIKGHTRVMTSFIAMNHSMGNYSTSIAMGLVLLIISFITNSILYKYVTGD